MFCRHPMIALLSLSASVLLFLLLSARRTVPSTVQSTVQSSVQSTVQSSEAVGAGGHLFAFCLFAAATLINPLVSHNGVTVLFVLNRNPVTLEALIYGAVTAAMLVSAIYWFRSFSGIMTGDRLLYLFGTLSPKAALILSMSLRYIPLFIRRTKQVRMAQKGMGTYCGDNIPHRMRSELRVFSIMLTWALEDGVVTADSMSARGYDTGRRTHFSIFRFYPRDGILLAVTAVLSAAVISAMAFGALDFGFYPALDGINTSPAAVAAYICYGILAFLPSILEITEKTRWKYLQSRI